MLNLVCNNQYKLSKLKAMPLGPHWSSKGMWGFVGGSRFKSQYEQKFTYQRKKKAKENPSRKG